MQIKSNSCMILTSNFKSYLLKKNPKNQLTIDFHAELPLENLFEYCCCFFVDIRKITLQSLNYNNNDKSRSHSLIASWNS
jgi:hypothetical protein